MKTTLKITLSMQLFVIGITIILNGIGYHFIDVSKAAEIAMGFCFISLAIVIINLLNLINN